MDVTDQDPVAERTVLAAQRARGFAEALGALLRRHGLPVGIVALDELVDDETAAVAVLVDVDDADDEVLARLRARGATLLALAAVPGPDRAGVDGWLSARQLEAVANLARLRPAASRGGALTGAHPDPKLESLTRREKEVLVELAAGRSYPELSERFGISLHTVRTHVRNLFAKLDVETRLQAVTMAHRAGLVTPRENGS